MVIVSSATAAPGRRDELVAAARAVAAATRSDHGCLAYAFSADLDDPDRILGLEIWADQIALDAHMAHPHTEAFLAAVPDLVAGPPDMTVHEVIVPG
nr:putative quinol monooxygenase [Geodermatophilus normandii]